MALAWVARHSVTSSAQRTLNFFTSPMGVNVLLLTCREAFALPLRRRKVVTRPPSTFLPKEKPGPTSLRNQEADRPFRARTAADWASGGGIEQGRRRHVLT